VAREFLEQTTYTIIGNLLPQLSNDLQYSLKQYETAQGS